MTDETERWLRCFHPRPSARHRLVCFPHASGNALFFRDWGARLPADTELRAVQYPGRLERLAEPCVADMHQMVDRITDALLPLLCDGDVALFGHSMGAAVAYEVALRLEHRYAIAVRHLFVSAHPSPRHHRSGTMHRGSADVLWDELRRLGNTSAEALAHAELQAVLLPALRRDYQLIETYRPEPAPPLSCPVTALGGRDDTDVADFELEDWGHFTAGFFRSVLRPGGHFYLVGQQDAVLAELTRGLAGTSR